MEGLLPSEVARLVYGYLEELKCTRAAQEFLKSCPLLSECLAAHNNGRKIFSRVYGHTLNQMLDDYCDAHTFILELQEKLPDDLSDAIQSSCFLGRKIQVLCDVIEKYKIAGNGLSLGNNSQQISGDGHGIRDRSSETSMLTNSASPLVQSTVNTLQTPVQPPVQSLVNQLQTPAQPLVQSPVNQVQTPAQPLVQSPVNSLQTPAQPLGSSPVNQLQTPAQPLVQSPVNSLQTPAQPLVQSPVNQLQTPSQPLVQSPVNQLQTLGQPLVQSPVNQLQTPGQPLVQSPVNQLQTPSQPLVQSPVNQLQTPSQPLVQSPVNQLCQLQTPGQPLVQSPVNPLQNPAQPLAQFEAQRHTLTNNSSPKDVPLGSNLLRTPQNVTCTSQILHVMETQIENCSNVRLSILNEEDTRGSPCRRKTPAKFQKSIATPATATASTTTKEKNFLSPEVFIKPMLENTQLHEKIAEAINNAMTSETLNNELNATISSVVEQTQSDPVFQRLVDEMFTLPPDPEDEDISSPEHDRLGLETMSTHTAMESSSTHHHRHSISPVHVPMLTFPMTPLAPSTPLAPNTPAGRAINILSADNDLNTPDHREVSRKTTNSTEVTGITEKSPKSNEVPLKARLRSSCKKNDPLPAITSKVVRETVPAVPDGMIQQPVLTAEPVIPAQNVQVETMEVDQPEKPVGQEQVQQEESGNIQSQNAQECFIVDDGVCVEMAPEVQAAFSKGGAVVLSHSSNTKDIIELAMTNSNLNPTVPRLMGGMQLVKQTYLQRPISTKIPNSNFVFVNQINPLMQQPVLPSQNIYLPEHAPFMPLTPLTSPAIQGQSQGNRFVSIAPKTPLPQVEQGTVRSVRRRTRRLGKSSTMQLDRKVPDRHIKINKNSNEAQPTSSLINIPRVQQVSQETIEAMVCPPPPPPTITPVKSILSMPSISPFFMPSDYQDAPLETYNVTFEPEQSEASAVVSEAAVTAETIEEEVVAEVAEIVPEPEPQPSTSNKMEAAENSTNQTAETSTNEVTQKEKTQENVVEKEAKVVSTDKAISPKVKESSVVRTSHNPRRQSLSTPRRDRNHVRTLDFSTPPRRGATPRRAHTSPKGRGSQRKSLVKNRFSPSTAKKLSRAAKIVRAGLFQSPNSCINSPKEALLSTVEETTQETNVTIEISNVIEEVLHNSPPMKEVPARAEIEETDTATSNLCAELGLNISDPHNTSTETSGSSSTLNTSTSSSTSSSSVSMCTVDSPFKSPQHARCDAITNTKSVVSNKSAVCGIATRTPGGPTVTKSCWDKVTGVELILGNSPVLTPSPVKKNIQQPTPQHQQTPQQESPQNIPQQQELLKSLQSQNLSPQQQQQESPQNLQSQEHQELPQILQQQQQELLISLQQQQHELPQNPLPQQQKSLQQEKQTLPKQQQIQPKRKIVKDWDSDLRALITKQSRESLLKSAEKACDKIIKRKSDEFKRLVGFSLSDCSSSDDDAFESPKRKETKKTSPVSNSSNKSKSSTKSKSISPKSKKQTLVTKTKNKKNIICDSQEDEDVVVDSETEQTSSELLDIVINPTDQIQQGMTLMISTDESCSTSQKVVVQSPRTVSKHVMHSEIQVSSSTKSPKKSVDMNNLLAAVAQSSSQFTPQKIDVPIGTPNPLEETPLTKLLREQPPHELTVIDTPVFPVTPNCDLLDSQCASPPSPNESPYYPPPRDTYEIQFEDTVCKQRKTTSNAATEEIQSARTSRNKSKKDKLNSSGDSNVSSSSSKKKSQVPSSSQILSVEQLLAAEQNRIGLKKPRKKSKKTNVTKEPDVNVQNKNVKEPKDRLRANNLYSGIKPRPVEEVQTVQLPIFSPSPPMLDDEVDMHDFNEEEEEEATALQLEKDMEFRELLDEKKQRLMQKLKRDFCKKEMPVVHLRVGGSKQNKATKATKGANKAQTPQPSTSKTTDKQTPEKSAAKRQQPSRASKTHAAKKADNKKETAKSQQNTVKNTVEKASTGVVKETCLSYTPPHSFLREILSVNTQCDSNQVAENVALVQQEQTECVSNVETSKTTDIPAVPSSSIIQTERPEVQKVVQISPQKLKSHTTTPRKSISVDEIANRLRSAAGLSDDEDMPPLVLQDSPVNVFHRPVRIGTPQKCRNILKQLELSPTKTRQEKTIEHPGKINEPEKCVTKMPSNISPEENIDVDVETEPSEDQSASTVEIAVVVEDNPVTSTEPEALCQEITTATEEPEISEPQNITLVQETCTPEVQPAKTPIKKVGCYSFQHDENVKYPEFIPIKAKEVTIRLDCLLDEGDGNGEQQKTVKISTTETYELLLVKPHKSRVSAENRPSTSNRHNDSRSSSRQYYPSHRDRDNSRYTSHKDRRSRSHSPPHERKSGRRHEGDRYYERRPSDSSRNRRSRSSSGSHNSRDTTHKRHRRSKEIYERRNVKHSGEREHRYRYPSDERDRQYSSGREGRDSNADRRSTEKHSGASKHNPQPQKSIPTKEVGSQQTAGNIQHTSSKHKSVENIQTAVPAQISNQAEIVNHATSPRERGNSRSVSPDHRSPRFSSPSSSSSGSDLEDKTQHSGGESPQMEDDLMTYALVGSERVAEPCAFELPAAAVSPRPAQYSEANLPVASKTNKRKATAMQNVPPAKQLKNNPQEMLREVGLDNLLSALHGDKDT